MMTVSHGLRVNLRARTVAHMDPVTGLVAVSCFCAVATPVTVGLVLHYQRKMLMVGGEPSELVEQKVAADLAARSAAEDRKHAAAMIREANLGGLAMGD